MNRPWTRRMFLGWGAGLGWSGLLAGCAPSSGLWTWTGILFGTEVSIQFAEEDRKRAESLSGSIGQRVRDLEQVFSLYDASSALRRLNQQGRLANPPGELLDALLLAQEVHSATDGVFDPTVQPLWELYSAYFQENPGSVDGPSEAAISEAADRIGFERVKISPEEIAFEKSGMAITLNGMAQGYLTDRLAEFLHSEGVAHALVNLGEYRALGTQPDGTAWQVGIRSPNPGAELLDVVPLEDASLATSGGYGYRFDPSGRFHHLMDPQGRPFQDAQRVISVEAPAAALADALATAGAIMDWETFAPLANRWQNVRFRIYPQEDATL